MPQVVMSLYQGKAKVAPLDRLGSLWNAYKSTCDAHGARFSKELKAQLVELHNVPELYVSLRTHGFSVTPSVELAQAVKERVATLEADKEAAGSRAKDIDLKLRERGLSLYGFQFMGVDELASHPSFVLADEMGLGKTVQALAAITGSAVVVCPASLKGNWVNEARRFRPDLVPVVLEGRKSFRWPRESEIVITNYAIIPAVAKGDKKNSPWAYVPGNDPGPAPRGVCLIPDEAHQLKNSKSKQHHSFKLLSKAVRANGGKVWPLTGTPILNRPPELWNLLEVADLGREAFSSWTNFCRMFNASADDWGSVAWGKPRPEVPKLLRRVMLRREVRDVLPDLPELTRRVETVAIDLETRALCDRAQRALEAAGISLDEAVEQSARFLRSGPAFEEISAARAALATAKIPAVEAIAERFEEEDVPLVVFSYHRAAIDVLSRRPGWARISGDEAPEDRTKIADAFQRGVLKGLAMTIQAGGVGFTLTAAWNAVFVDLAWTPALNDQAERRVLRIGQTRGVTVTRCVADHPVDERVFEILDGKQRLIKSSIEAARVGADGELVETSAENPLPVEPSGMMQAHVVSPAQPPHKPGIPVVGMMGLGASATDLAGTAPEMTPTDQRVCVCPTVGLPPGLGAHLGMSGPVTPHVCGVTSQTPSAPAIPGATAQRARLVSSLLSDPVAGDVGQPADTAIGDMFHDSQRTTETDRPTFRPRPPRDAVEEWAARGLAVLAGNDPDGARSINNVGFSKTDTGFGHDMAAKLARFNGLTDRQWAATIRMLRKYHRQVGHPPGKEE